ncbi:MAG: hypothetical protein JWM39_166 [Parcubacteria group bacterium]|nr:hypothetical protein [Parcubacteria group bacterium]
MKRKLSVRSLRLLFWITIANYIAQIPYYLYNYYFPYHVLPTVSAIGLLGFTLLWFLVGYFGTLHGLKYCFSILIGFLSVEALFYLHSFVFGAFFFQMQNPHLIIKTVFLVGYISGAAAGYYVYRLIKSPNA